MKKEDRTNVKLNQIEKHRTNPFVVDLKGKMFLQPRANTIIARGQSIVDTDTGEIIDDSVLIGRRKIVDKSQFAKIYASEIGILYELSKSAQNVFLYLIKVMDYDNKAYFNYRQDYEILGYKNFNTPYLGIKELIQRNLIAPAIMMHYFWLNPTVVCKGERFAIYTEYITQEKAEKINKEAFLKRNQLENATQLDEETANKLKKMNDAEERKYIEENRPRVKEMTMNFDDPNNPFITDYVPVDDDNEK